MENYDTYHKKLENMIIQNQQMENIFLKAYQYIDYDEISHVTNIFESKISFLKESNIRKEFGEHIFKDIERIENDYLEKIGYSGTF